MITQDKEEFSDKRDVVELLGSIIPASFIALALFADWFIGWG